MIRTILGNALLLAADALGALPAPERWEAELDVLRQQIGDLDAAVADRFTAEHDQLRAALDAARDGLRTAQSCLDRVGEARVVDALAAVERVLARSAPSLSDPTTPRTAAEVVREAVVEAPAADPATPDPTAEQIEAYLRGSENWELQNGAWESRGLGFDALWKIVEPIGDPAECVAFLARTECRTPAEMRARILGASAQAEDPDRLAEPTDEELGRIVRAQANSLGYDAAGRALYNLGREHGGRAASAIATESIAMGHAVRRELCATRSSLAHALDCVSEAKMQLDRDEVSKALDALGTVENGLAKATPDPLDKAAELRAAGWRHKEGHGWSLGAYGLGYLDTHDAYRAMVEDREREKARATVPNPFTAERFMQLALLNAEWECNNLGWHRPNRIGFDVLTTYTTTEAAFECMLADRAKAAPPRDTMTQPEPGDLYVDDFGRAYICDKAGTVKCVSASEQAAMPNRFRRANPEEIAKFRKDHGLGPCTAPARTALTATLPSKEDMAAELRAAGWYVLREAHPAGTAHPERWTNATGKAPRAALADAYAAMLADRAKAESAAPASPPRDTLTQPEPGDLFVDRDGDTWLYATASTYTLRADDVHIHAKMERFRPANPEEIAKFRKDHGL